MIGDFLFIFMTSYLISTCRSFTASVSLNLYFLVKVSLRSFAKIFSCIQENNKADSSNRFDQCFLDHISVG